MKSKYGTSLAELMGFTYLKKGGPFQGRGAVGEKNGFTLGIDWVKRKKQKCVAFNLGFKKGTLKESPAEAVNLLLSDSAVLEAVGQKKFSHAERRAAGAGESQLTFFWDYSVRAPKPEEVAKVAEAAIHFMEDHSAPIGNGCQACGAESGGTLYCVAGRPVMLCGSCADRVRTENMEKERAWEAVQPRFLTGILAGAALAVVAALAWGGLAYETQRIYAMLAIGIGFCVAWAVRLGMRKVTTAGKIAAFALTIASVMAGEFFYILLEVSKLAKVQVSSGLAHRILPHFFQLEFTRSSGWFSLLFALIGAAVALSILKQKAPGTELISIQEAKAVQATV